MKRIIEPTDDGSTTLYVPELNEHYHSTKGARTESQHIFIDMGLKASPVAAPHILEIGFGTGLNAWLTLVEAEKSHRDIHYTGIELYPLDWETVEQLHYITCDEQITADGQSQPAIDLFRQLHTSLWGEKIALTSHFTLQKIQADFTRCPLSALDDAPFTHLYFDAFAPEKQPEMWSQALFNQLYAATAQEGILTTYCAKGIVRRMLQTAGFIVERLPGPPGGKREILRARKQ